MTTVVDTWKFRLNPDDETKAVLSRYAGECRRVMNHIFREKWVPFVQGMTKYSLDAEFIRGEKSIDEDFELRSKSHYEGLLTKVTQVVRKQNVLFGRSFIPCRSRMGRLRQEDGQYIFGVRHPYEPGWLEMSLEPGHGKLEWRQEGIKKMEELIDSNSDFPSFEIHRTRWGGWILHISLKDGAEEQGENLMGVDLGIRNVAVAVVRNEEGEHVATQFWKGGELQRVMRQFQARKKELQEKGKAKQVSMSGWTNAYIQKVAKEMTDFAVENGVGEIRFENLKGFRARNVSVNRGGKTMRRSNRMLNQWQRGRLLRAVEQKALREGILTKEVSAAYTSRTCPKCREVRDAYADVLFTCPSCGYTNNRDWVGAWNVGE